MKLLYFFLLIIFSASALGQSIGISPAKIVFHDSQDTQQLRLYNPNDHSITYSLSVDDHAEAFSFAEEGEIPPHRYQTVILQLNSAKVLTAFTTQLVATYHFGEEPGLGILPQATAEISVELTQADQIFHLQESLSLPPEKKATDYRVGAFIMAVIVICGVGLFYLARFI